MYIRKKGDEDMHTQAKTWGNSQGLHLSKEILNTVNITVGDVLDVKISNGVIALAKSFRHKTLEERAMTYAGKLNLDGEFDFGEPVGREIW